MSNKCNLDGDTTLHVSGLRTMPHPAGMAASIDVTVPLPSCCPVSGNPQEGSSLTLSYRPRGRVIETYSLEAVVKQFKRGFPGVGPVGPDGTRLLYRAERNMEGMVHLLCQMAADAAGVRVRARADLILDTGAMVISTRAVPANCD
jgi:hypothetical protein